MKRARVIAASIVALLVARGEARADAAKKPPARTPTALEVMAKLRGGDDLMAQAPVAATLTNTWSAPLSASWIASARLFAGPLDQAVSSFLVARVLNGTTWSLLLGLELATVRTLGGGWGFLQRVDFTTDHRFGFGVPAGCVSPWATRGCGLGLGGTDELRGHLRGSPWVFTLTGGWIQGRVASDERRTVIESTWLFSPVAAQLEAGASFGPLHASAALGPGLYFGMHTAHVHPESSKDRLGIPWHGLYPLDGGIGLGLRADATLTIARVIALSGTVIVAPMLGRSIPAIDPIAAPVRSSAGESFLSWRTASVGASVELPGTQGIRLGLRYWVGELSSRPLPKAGHQAISLRWEVPLRP
jgi:hypothetical protein